LFSAASLLRKTQNVEMLVLIREFKMTEKPELVLKTYQMNDNVFSENKRFAD
jgi:hypothetical protein